MLDINIKSLHLFFSEFNKMFKLVVSKTRVEYLFTDLIQVKQYFCR